MSQSKDSSSSDATISSRYFPSSVLLWSQPVRAFLEEVAKRGFSGAEVWAQHVQHSGETGPEIRRKADELGLALTVHAVSYDLNPLSRNPEIREVSRRQVHDSLRLADELRGEVVVVHPGQLSSSTDDPEVYWPDLLDFASALDEHASQLGLTVGIEAMERKLNQFFVEPPALNRLADAMEQEGWSSLGLTVDLAHLATFTDPLVAFPQVRRAVHAHVSDGQPPTATHRPFGLGTHPIGAMLDLIESSAVPRIAIEGRWRKEETLALDRAAAVLAERARANSAAPRR